VGIEPTIRVLQTRALPLGYVAALPPSRGRRRAQRQAIIPAAALPAMGRDEASAAGNMRLHQPSRRALGRQAPVLARASVAAR
jgi:hypothetical protein